MPYRYEITDRDYSDYSSGRVLYSLPGAPAFPVRLASEIFQRARQRLPVDRPLTLYDPTCGGAYHLCALGFLHGREIQAIIASDVNEQALDLARRNLGLLSLAGLDRRIGEIEQMLAQYGKPSHAEALASARRLRKQLEALQPGHTLRTRVFQANALDGERLRLELEHEKIDLVISDIPYGKLSTWQTAAEAGDGSQSPARQMLAALRPSLSGTALVAIAADKRQKIAHEQYRRVERFQIGKREITLLQPEPELTAQ